MIERQTVMPMHGFEFSAVLIVSVAVDSGINQQWFSVGGEVEAGGIHVGVLILNRSSACKH